MNDWWRHNKNRILFDSGFWIGLIDDELKTSEDYRNFLEEYQNCIFMIPYPSLAEFFNDQLLRRPVSLDKIKRIFNNKSNMEFYKHNMDEKESIEILDEFLSSPPKLNREAIPNFIDIIIGRIIEDTTAPFTFVTTNSGDFYKYFNKCKNSCTVVDFNKKEVSYPR